MSIEIVAKLKALKLHGMAHSWPELVAQTRHTELDPQRFMTQLLAAEQAERDVCSVAYQMKAARCNFTCSPRSTSAAASSSSPPT